jgi:Domain of unknown function (DUF4105)
MTVLRVLRWLGLVILALMVLSTGVWSALALWYRSGFGDFLQGPTAAFAVLVAVAATIGLATSKRWIGLGIYAAAFALVLVWWSTITPSGNRNWTPDVARNVTAAVDGNRLVVTNVRNFKWRSDTNFDQRWEQRTYDLAELSNVDLIMSYWGSEAIAHTIISFGFTNGDRLAFSIETRKEVGEGYSPIAGFFKQYELAIVAADERDVVQVRTNVRDEDVRIYRLRMTPPNARTLLLAYVAEANELASRPRFYNTLTTNCTTLVFQMVRMIHPGLPLDPRVLLSGYLPDYVYQLGATNTAMPFERLRALSRVSVRALQVGGDQDFSRKIRQGVPVPN